MKTSAALLIMFSVFLCQPCLASADELTPNDVIGNINEQLKAGVTAKVVMEIKKGDKVVETKRFDLLMEVDRGKEVIKGKIFEPASRRGTFTIMWDGGRASIKHIEIGRGRERRISTPLGGSFLGGSAAWVDVKILEDTENYEYEWVVKRKEDMIVAISKNTMLTVYGKRALMVEKKNGMWAINQIKYYSEKGRLIKIRENMDFAKVGSGLRPGVIIVKKGGYKTVLHFDWKSKTVFD